MEQMEHYLFCEISSNVFPLATQWSLFFSDKSGHFTNGDLLGFEPVSRTLVDEIFQRIVARFLEDSKAEKSS